MQSMATLQLYGSGGGCGSSGGESSLEPSPCPSPIPVVPSLTTNFPLLPTSPLRYPHPLQPVFFRMATPPNTQPQRPRANSANAGEETFFFSIQYYASKSMISLFFFYRLKRARSPSG